jgi:HSP20 family protein
LHPTGSRAPDVLNTRGGDLVICLELPGIDPEKDPEITVEDGTLHVHCDRRETEEAKGHGYFRRETFYGSFERAMPAAASVEAEDLKATSSKGVMEVVVPGAGRHPSQPGVQTM